MTVNSPLFDRSTTVEPDLFCEDELKHPASKMASSFGHSSENSWQWQQQHKCFNGNLMTYWTGNSSERWQRMLAVKHSQHKHLGLNTHTHKRFTALFLGPPGWAGARKEPLDFMVQGKINRGRHTVRLGATPSKLTSAHLHQTPIFYRPDAVPPPNQQCQSTEGNKCRSKQKHNWMGTRTRNTSLNY